MLRALSVLATLWAATVRAEERPRVSFQHDVVPIMTKMGCNSGACHGTPSGKNGFRLSLRRGGDVADDASADDANGFPCYGAVVSHRRPGPRGVPGHVALPHVMYNVVKLPGQTAGYLGAAYNPFHVTGDPNDPNFRVAELDLPANLSPDRLEARRSLLAALDQRAAREGYCAAISIRSPHRHRRRRRVHPIAATRINAAPAGSGTATIDRPAKNRISTISA